MGVTNKSLHKLPLPFLLLQKQR